MEDLWKLSRLDFRLVDIADRAEYDRLVRRYRDEEEHQHRDRLLYGDDRIEPDEPIVKE